MRNVTLTIILIILAFVISILLGSSLIEIFWIGNAAKGLTYFAVGVAIYSVFLAIRSDEKMRAIANADFFALVYTFEDRAIPLYNGRPNSGARDTFSWRLLNYFQQADKLKKWVAPDVQKRLVHELQYLIENLQYAITPKVWVEFKNYRKACDIAIGFKVDEEVKDELIYQLGYYIGYKDEGETNSQYLERKRRELATRERFNIFERVIETTVAGLG